MTQKTKKFADALSSLGALPPEAPLGVLDIGSNSVRLVGFSGSARTPLPIYNERAFCRLGAAVAATGRIEGEPYRVAIATFHRFRAIAARLGIDKLAVFATAAVRDAENRAEFVAEVEDILGHKVRVLSGKEEATYSADGVMLSIPKADGIVADLGGGSLELARVKNNKTVHWATLPLGVLALKQKSDNDKKHMAKLVRQQLAAIDWLKEGRDLPLYVVGGTWRNLAQVHMNEENYPLVVLHQYETKRTSLTRLARQLAVEDSDQTPIDLTGTSSNRRAALPASAIVLDRLMHQVKPSRIIVSAHAVREGVLHSILKKKYRKLDPLLLACEEMAERMCKSAAYGHELANWTASLFSQSTPQFTTAKQLNRMRQAGCLISDLAWASHPSFRAQMVAQTVLTAPFSGIDHKQRVFLARALAYRHEMDEQEADFASLSLSRKDERLAFAFGSSLRLAHSLSTSLPGLLPHTRLAVTGDKLRLTIDPKFTELDGPILDKRLGLTARLLGLKPEIVFRKVKRQGKVKRQSKAKRA